jgi:hypothetical protein
MLWGKPPMARRGDRCGGYAIGWMLVTTPVTEAGR